jgi:dTDP-4-dehydrorhamnose reductase
MDLGAPERIREGIRELRPALIVNAAAYTAVDHAEDEPDLAWAVNAVAPGILAEEAKALNAPLVHYSTDYVFDGRGAAAGEGGGPRPYRESDPPGPLNHYGRSKLAGEQLIQAAGSAHLIFRTSWLYAAHGRNFLQSILKQAREKPVLTVVSDQIGSPTWVRWVAESTARILSETWARDGAEDLGEKGGLYHMAAAGWTSWHDFAEAIIARARAEEPGAIKARAIEQASTAALNLRAQRPRFSALDCTALREAFGIALPDWKQQLDRCLNATEQLS